jgi:hypothetical protein
VPTKLEKLGSASKRAPSCFARLRRPAALLGSLALVAILGVPSANAQTIKKSGSPSTNVQLGFAGLVSTSVQLSIVGSGPTTLSSTTSTIAPTPAAGTINFGSFNALQPSGATNANFFRISSGTTGAVIAASLIATLVYNGSTTGSVTVARKNAAGGPPDVPLANLRIASPPLASWTSGSQGTQVPNAGSPGLDICQASGAATCANNTPYRHQLAVFVPDSQPTGAFTTVVVYTGVSP